MKKYTVTITTFLILVLSSIFENYFKGIGLFCSFFAILVFNVVLNRLNRYVFTPFLSILVLTIVQAVISILLGKKIFLWGLTDIILILISCIIPYFIKKIKLNYVKGIILFLYFSLIAAYSYYIPKLYENKVAFGSFTGDKNIDLKHDYAFLGFSKGTEEKLSISDFKDKTIVLDFWNNNCGVCFEKFPKVDELRSKVTNKNVMFLAVNVFKRKSEIKNGLEMFRDEKLGYNTLFISEENAKELQVYAYPTVLVIKDNKIVYRGTIEVLDVFKNKYFDK